MKDKYIRQIEISTPSTMEYSVPARNPKEIERFVKRCERVIRSSIEYRDYIAFLRDNVDMDKCAFFNKVSKESGRHIKIEIHHEPFTLYEIVMVVVQKHIAEGTTLNDLFISDEVMQLHYENKVGLIPLSKSIHQAVHSPGSKIIIPIHMCYGDYKQFVVEYDIPDQMLSKLESKINISKELVYGSFDVLSKCFEYIKVDGFELPQKIERDVENVV